MAGVVLPLAESCPSALNRAQLKCLCGIVSLEVATSRETMGTRESSCWALLVVLELNHVGDLIAKICDFVNFTFVPSRDDQAMTL